MKSELINKVINQQKSFAEAYSKLSNLKNESEWLLHLSESEIKEINDCEDRDLKEAIEETSKAREIFEKDFKI